MNETINILTDPARELAEICTELQENASAAGEIFLAGKFNVTQWSREFYQILFTIIERCDLLKKIVDTIDLDNDFREEVKSHVYQIECVFNADSMKQPWKNCGLTYVSAVNVGPIKAISGLVRQKVWRLYT